MRCKIFSTKTFWSENKVIAGGKILKAKCKFPLGGKDDQPDQNRPTDNCEIREKFEQVLMCLQNTPPDANFVQARKEISDLVVAKNDFLKS